MDISEERLRQLIDAVGEADREAMAEAAAHQAALAKPPGSLGRLEALAVQLAGITGKVHPSLEHKTVLVFAADNGVVKEGVASAPQSVTLAQSLNLTRGKTGAAVLAAAFHCELRVIDVGIAADESVLAGSKVIPMKIAKGTRNIAEEAAMSREQAVQALLAGAEAAEAAVRDGAEVLGIGEMGIGNTTTSAAVLSVLTGKPVEAVTGRGAGITDDAYEKKLDVIRTAIRINAPDPGDVIDVLAKVGGFDIAAMAGAFIGAAYLRTPVVIDGLISVTAALAAYCLCPNVLLSMIPSHRSAEPGYLAAAEALSLKPLFDLEMRLGEGSGCPVAMMILDAACAVNDRMATFEEAGIDDSYLEEIRRIDAFTVRKNEGEKP